VNSSEGGLTVAVTGPTGTFGFALVPRLEAEPQVAEVRGIARRAFDPAAHGWTKTTYHRGDVRDRDALLHVFEGADVVVHLAFLIMGTAPADVLRAVNVDGTLNVFRAAASAGVPRFVYTSSVAAYGFHPDNPIGMREDWPTRPDHRFFYAAEKAEIEERLRVAAARDGAPELFVLRPPVVLGPHAVGAKDVLPQRLRPLGSALVRALRDAPRVPVPVPLPALPVQLIHDDDVADALCRCIVGDAPAGAYNIAGDGIVTLHDVVRELGLVPLPVPTNAGHRAARAVAALPLPSFLPPVTGWAEALAHPAIMDTTKAARELGWRPRHPARETLHTMLHPAR
jgi:nucleoside-diphosphate-sugar epimerase